MLDHPAKPLLEVENLSKAFGGRSKFLKQTPSVYAVNGVDLTLHAGETLGIVGESGCGKSTLSRMLAGVIDPTAGRFVLKGQDLTALPQAARQKAMIEIQMIFQSPFSSLNPRMRAVDMVREPLDIHRSDLPKAKRREMAMAMLAEVGISAELAQRYPHQMSGGQQQRVGIARALISDVSIVICDEPVSALDVSVQAQVIDLLRRLQAERGLAYLFVSHDLAVVGALSDRIAVMYLGRIIEIGDCKDILDNPLHPYTQVLLESANLPDPELERNRDQRVLDGDLPKPTDPDVGCRFASRCWKAQPLCRSNRPELVAPAEAGHQVACHFAL